MANEAFIRRFRVNVGGTQFDSTPQRPLRFAFQITRDNQLQPNNATVTVWGLNRTTRAKLLKRDSIPVKIEVGYEGGRLHTIFFGDLRQIEQVREGADIKVIINAGDGETAIKGAKINQTFPKGSSFKDIVSQMVTGASEGTPENSATGMDAKTKGALTVQGNALEEANKMAQAFGANVHVQDGVVKVQDLDAKGGTGPLITPATGLVGSPQLDSQSKLKMRCIILPDLIPGSSFRLKTGDRRQHRLEGQYVVERSRYIGDSTSDQWFIDVFARQRG